MGDDRGDSIVCESAVSSIARARENVRIARQPLCSVNYRAPTRYRSGALSAQQWCLVGRSPPRPPPVATLSQHCGASLCGRLPRSVRSDRLDVAELWRSLNTRLTWKVRHSCLQGRATTLRSEGARQGQQSRLRLRRCRPRAGQRRWRGATAAGLAVLRPPTTPAPRWAGAPCRAAGQAAWLARCWRATPSTAR